MKIWTEEKLIEEGYSDTVIWELKNLAVMVQEWNPLLE